MNVKSRCKNVVYRHYYLLFWRASPRLLYPPLISPPFIICLITVCQNTATKLVWEKCNSTASSFLYMPAPSAPFAISLLWLWHSPCGGGVLLRRPCRHSAYLSTTVNSLTPRLFSSRISTCFFYFNLDCREVFQSRTKRYIIDPLRAVVMKIAATQTVMLYSAPFARPELKASNSYPGG